jgi:hypothetical protein
MLLKCKAHPDLRNLKSDEDQIYSQYLIYLEIMTLEMLNAIQDSCGSSSFNNVYSFFNNISGLQNFKL